MIIGVCSLDFRKSYTEHCVCVYVRLSVILPRLSVFCFVFCSQACGSLTGFALLLFPLVFLMYLSELVSLFLLFMTHVERVLHTKRRGWTDGSVGEELIGRSSVEQKMKCRLVMLLFHFAG